RGKSLHAQACGAEQHRQRVAHGVVVIDDVDRALARRGRHHRLAAGRVNENLVPPAAGASQWIVPPCNSITERQMLRPRPSPPGLSVTKGSNSRSRIAGDTPSPRSATDRVTEPSAFAAEAIVTRRRSGASCCIASMAL